MLEGPCSGRTLGSLVTLVSLSVGAVGGDVGSVSVCVVVILVECLGVSITGACPNTAVGLGRVCVGMFVSGAVGSVICLGVSITGGLPKKDVCLGLGVGVVVGVVGGVVCVSGVVGGLVCSGGGSLVLIL